MNKVSCITDKDIKKLIEVHKRGIKQSYIYNCSFNKWANGLKKDIEEIERCGSNSDELDMYKKMSTKEYFTSRKNGYIEDLKLLEDENTSKEELLKIFERHSFTFSIKNDEYNLSDCGWCDQYRVSGYPTSKSFTNADEAIKFLEEYDNGKNITYDFKDGMCDEIREVIKKFFKEYPNGFIYYG